MFSRGQIRPPNTIVHMAEIKCRSHEDGSGLMSLKYLPELRDHSIPLRNVRIGVCNFTCLTIRDIIVLDCLSLIRFCNTI